MWHNLASIENERKIETGGITYFINKCVHCPYAVKDYDRRAVICTVHGFDIVLDINSEPDKNCPLEKRYKI